MTKEEKAFNIASRLYPNDVYDNALSYDGCKKMLEEFAQYKNAQLSKMKYHADEMHDATQNLSSDGYFFRKAMRNHRNYIFT